MTRSGRWCERCSFHEASSVIGGLGEVILVFRYDEAEEDPIFMGRDYGFSLRKTSFFFFSLKKNFRCVLCACCACRSQQRAVDPLWSELQTVVSWHRGASAEPSLHLPTSAIFLQSRACPRLLQTFPAWVNHSRSFMPQPPLALPTPTTISPAQSFPVKLLILPPCSAPLLCPFFPADLLVTSALPPSTHAPYRLSLMCFAVNDSKDL